MWFLERGREAHEGGLDLAVLAREALDDPTHLLAFGTGPRAYHCDPPMEDCDFDYDGFGGGPWDRFLKWSGARFASLDEVRKSAPVYRHAVLVDAATAFASGARPPDDVNLQVAAPPDLRLKPGTTAADAGQALPGLNDGYSGAAPDLGAYELGDELPPYGPRPDK
jgi:hypothetical protein